MTGELFNVELSYDYGSGNTFFDSDNGTVVGLPPPPAAAPFGDGLSVTFRCTLAGGMGSFVGGMVIYV